MRRSLASLLLLLLLSPALQVATAINSDTAKRLFDRLMEHYDRQTPPIGDSGHSTQITFHMDVHELDLESYDLFSAETWTYWEWKDNLLKWDPSQYDSITEIMVEASSIWTPELVHISRGQLGNSLQSAMQQGGSCRVVSSGNVSCLAEARYDAHCNIDLAKWPYDIQTCRLSFFSWQDFNNQLNVMLRNGTGFSLKYLKPTPQWQVLDVRSNQVGHSSRDDRDFYNGFEFLFTFKRHSEVFIAVSVTPAIVLAMATLLTLLMPPWQPERFSVGLCLLVAHYVTLTQLYHNFQHQGTVPLVLLLLRDSMVMVAVALMQAVVMRALIHSGVEAPNYVVDLLDKVPTWRWGLSLLAQPKEENTGRKEAHSSAVWRQMATLADRTGFCIYCFVFVILMARMLP